VTEVVLDASALIAHARREAGHERVQDLLLKAVVSAVNLSEFVSRMVDLGYNEETIRRLLAALPCRIATFDGSSALESGILRGPTKHRGLSLGDRACLALAAKLGSPALTADRAWTELDLGIEVVLIR